jgi:hypothetical protein
LRRRTDLIGVHGAVILTARGLALIVGASSAGKSTLAAALGARGYTVGSDDMAFLDPGTDRIAPLPRCFHLDARSIRILRSMGIAVPAIAKRDGFFTPARLAPLRSPPRVVAVLSFVRGVGDRAEIARLTQAEMAAAMLSQTWWGRHSSSEVLTALGRLAGRAACYRLTRGSLVSTTEVVGQALGPP